jgi:hypothetical protein
VAPLTLYLKIISFRGVIDEWIVSHNAVADLSRECGSLVDIPQKDLLKQA